MKIRRGFVTNSSSTNFGVMLVTALSSVSAASFLSIWDNIFGVDNSKHKDYIRLVVEAPGIRTLKIGESSYIKAMIVKASIIEGKFKDELEVAGKAVITLIKGKEIIDTIEGEGSENLTFTITSDKELLLKNDGNIIFSVTGEGMSQEVEFKVPFGSVEPEIGVYFAGKGTKNEVNIKANSNSKISFNIGNCKLLSLNEDENVQGSASYGKYTLTECTKEEDINKYFSKDICKIDNIFNGMIEGVVLPSTKYTARLVRECIIVPKTTKEPIEIKLFRKEESEDIKKNSAVVHFKVMKYNDEKKDMECDLELTNNLTFKLEVDDNFTKVSKEKVEEIIASTEVKAEIIENGQASDTKKYATYRVCGNLDSSNDSEEVEVFLKVIATDENIDELNLKVKLLPYIDYKGMIKWFIERSNGTFIGNLVKLGEVATYFRAIDFINSRIYEHSKAPSPKTKENHYEDGKLDVSRPRAIVLRKESMPKQIGEFTQIQSLYHELSHTVEDMNGDIKLFGNSGEEKHSYFLQYLSDAVKALTDIERNFSDTSLALNIRDAIGKYYLTFFNPNNVEPIDYFQDFNWFGSNTPSQHIIFDKYANLSLFYEGKLLKDEQIQKISNTVRRYYFPGNIKGSFFEQEGYFKGSEWKFVWSGGELINLYITKVGFTFDIKSIKWQGGNTLDYKVVVDIKADDGRIDTLEAKLKGGTFDQFDYHNPYVKEFALTWNATYKLSDSIMGSYIGKIVKLSR